MLFWRKRHQVDEETLNAFADGELDAVEAARVTFHVDACAACGETLAELRALSGALSSLAVELAPRSFVLREADVTPAPQQQNGLLAGAMPLLGGVAAVAFLAFFILVGVDVTGNGSSGDADAGDAASPLSVAETTQPSNYDMNGGALEAEPGARGPADDAALDGDGPAPAVEAPPLPATGEEFSAEVQDPDGDLGGADGTIPDESSAYADSQLRADDGDSSRLRLAQSATAAVALVAGGAVVAMWWRRRTSERS